MAGLDMETKNLLIHVATMKYKLDMTQKEIADRLGYSSMQISRLIDRAKKEGIVRIEIESNPSVDDALGNELKNKYNLEDVYVFHSVDKENQFNRLVSEAASYMDLIIGQSDVVGLAGGRTETKIIPKMKLPAIKCNNKLTVVQLAGGFLDFSSSSPFSTIHEFSLKFGAKGYFLPTPFYVKNPIALNELWNGSLSEIRKVWRKCTVTVNGIGTIGEDSLFVRQKAVTCEQMNELVSKGAVGNLLGRWYDRNGNFIDCDLNREATSIPVEDFMNINRRVLVSGDQDRLLAIHAVLNKGIYNVFITIDSVAESLIDMK